MGALGNNLREAVPHFGARPCPYFGAVLRVESLRTILRFEEALGLRVKLVTQNGNVLGPFQEGNREADQGLLQAQGLKGTISQPLQGMKGWGGEGRGNGSKGRKEEPWGVDTLSLCICTKVLGKRDLEFFVSVRVPHLSSLWVTVRKEHNPGEGTGTLFDSLG